MKFYVFNGTDYWITFETRNIVGGDLHRDFYGLGLVRWMVGRGGVKCHDTFWQPQTSVTAPSLFSSWLAIIPETFKLQTITRFFPLDQFM